MTTFFKQKDPGIWPQNIPLKDARKKWKEMNQNNLINVLSEYHNEWIGFKNEELQVSAYLDDHYKQLRQIKTFNEQQFQHSQTYIMKMIGEISHISQKKGLIIDLYKKQTSDSFQELLLQWKQNEFVFDENMQLQNLNSQLLQDKNDLIEKYDEIQQNLKCLHEQLSQYHNQFEENPQFFKDQSNWINDQKQSLDQLQAGIRNIINKSELLLEFSTLLIQRNQTNQSDSTPELINQFIKTLTYNNEFLVRLSEILLRSWNQLINIQQQNQIFEKEIVEQTQEIDFIKTQFYENQSKFLELLIVYESNMEKLKPADYDSHSTKMEKIGSELRKLKSHFCNLGSKLFLRILIDFQYHIQSVPNYQNRQLEEAIFEQIKLLKEPCNLDQQENLINLNITMLDQFSSEKLTINKEILLQLQAMLKPIHDLQSIIQNR